MHSDGTDLVSRSIALPVRTRRVPAPCVLCTTTRGGQRKYDAHYLANHDPAADAGGEGSAMKANAPATKSPAIAASVAT